MAELCAGLERSGKLSSSKCHADRRKSVNVATISAEYDAIGTAAGAFTRYRDTPCAAVAICRRRAFDRGPADRLDRAVVICRFDRQSGTLRLDRARGRARP